MSETYTEFHIRGTLLVDFPKITLVFCGTVPRQCGPVSNFGFSEARNMRNFGAEARHLVTIGAVPKIRPVDQQEIREK
jgi:hypothetical protein